MTETEGQVRTAWTTGYSDQLNTGTWRTDFPVYLQRQSPCTNNCPLHNQTPDWMQLLKDKQYHQAWLTLVAENPFPAVTGRVCHHPCEKACNRDQFDEAVAVQNLECYLGDMALAEGWTLPAPLEREAAKIAVVGAGPAGLAAAYYLNRNGYQVTVFEQRPKAGGLLRYGIPAYRLAKDILDQEIARLVATGIEIRTNAPVGPAKLTELEAEYQAVFLAVGAQKSKTLPQVRELGPKAIEGLEFLAEINEGKNPDLGQEVVVIGGGSSAMDVARSARRLGKQVKILSLEAKEQLPAQAAEVAEALEEGIMLFAGSMLEKAVITENQKIRLTCSKVTLDQNVPPGVLKPIKLPGTSFEIRADNIILAIGQDPELTGFPVETTNQIITVLENFRTNREKTFAGGDAASLNRFVSVAFGQGKAAAQSIITELTGENQPAGEETEEVSFAQLNTFYFPFAGKLKTGKVEPAKRIHHFQEIKLAVTEEQALTEAQRCFSCGHCTQCDICFYYCPDMAVVKKNNQEDTDPDNYYILEQYCKGCGLCVKECPRGVLLLKEEEENR